MSLHFPDAVLVWKYVTSLPFHTSRQGFVGPLVCLYLQTPKLFCLELIFFKYILIKFFPSPNLNGPYFHSHSILYSLSLFLNRNEKQKQNLQKHKNTNKQKSKMTKNAKTNKTKLNEVSLSHTQTTTTKAHRVTFTLSTTPGHRPGIEGVPYTQ